MRDRHHPARLLPGRTARGAREHEPRPLAGTVDRRAHGPVPERTPGPTPLFTRHTRGVIEAERDRRRQRRARGAASTAHPEVGAAVADDARVVAQARLDMDRWVNEGGMVPFEAAAVLRATSMRR
jgi:hypothetical protein